MEMALHVAPVRPYEIVSAIGEGGMGEVYKARDKRSNRIVASRSSPAVRGRHGRGRNVQRKTARCVVESLANCAPRRREAPSPGPMSHG